MSDPFDGSANDDAVELEEGRGTVDGTWSPDWILLSGCSAQALKLYQLMRLRLNRKRRDSKVWPGTATLAAMMGMKISGSITPYLKELEKIGAITIRRERMPRRNVYVIHTSPKRGYDGPMVMEDWDHDPDNKLEVARIRAAEKEKRNRTRGQSEKPQVKPDPAKNRDQAGPMPEPTPDPAKNRDQDPAKNQDHDTVKNRDHSYEEPVLNEPPPPATSSAADQGQEEQELAPPASNPDPAAAGGLTESEHALFSECMAARPDWSPSELRDVLASPEIRDRPDRGLVRRAFLMAVDDLGTKPNRMLHGACPHWKAALYKQRAESPHGAPTRPARVGMYDGPVSDKPTVEARDAQPSVASEQAAALFAQAGFRSRRSSAGVAS